MKSEEFTLADFMAQMRQARALGPMGWIGRLLFRRLTPAIQFSEAELHQQMKQMEAIYQSMTTQERLEPRILRGSRQRRIALGAGTSVSMVDQFLRQYEMTRAFTTSWWGPQTSR